MKLKTYWLTGQALDWAVAQAVGVDVLLVTGIDGQSDRTEKLTFLSRLEEPERESGSGSKGVPYEPSLDWSQCGPLIAEHSIMLAQSGDKWYAFSKDNEFNPYRGSHYIDCLFNDADGWGETPLIAACHAIVASCIGEDIDIPDELCSPLDDLIRS